MTATTTATEGNSQNDEPTITANNIEENTNYYQESSLTSCPPLLQLQIYGLCCPFIITEEEHDARIGVSNLHNYPITWYRKKKVRDAAYDVLNVLPPNNAARGVMDGVIGQLFGSGNGGGGGGAIAAADNGRGKGRGVGGASIPMTYIGIPSTLTIIDTDTHGPTIQIRSLDGWDDPNNVDAQDAVREFMTHGKPWWENESLYKKPPTKIIPLYMVDKVTSSGWNFSNDGSIGGVRLYAAPTARSSSSSSESNFGGIGDFLNGGLFGHELLRFDTLGGGGETLHDSLSAGTQSEPNKYSDKVIVQLKSLIDWNRRRVAKDIKSGRVAVAPKGNDSSAGYIATKL